ncbi:MAG: branched-chain amino acid ABC transporter permease [Tannerellaceae bacterium]|nr:branched-chain amino acid ABC transporter permease [Tannerellaceae bacterium]
MDYILHIIILINLYIILVLSANLTVGLANLMSLCQAAFYGIGAYISAYFLLQTGLPFIVITLFVILFTGATSLIVSLISIKLKGDYFLLATLAFQMIVYSILYNWVEVTQGPYGIIGIPTWWIFEFLNLSRIHNYFIVTTLVALLVIFIFQALKFSPFGRILTAIRSDELSLEALGRSPLQYKSLSFFISAGFSGLAGFLYATYISYIDPTSFTIDESIFILTALFIGGIGNIKGPVLGAVFVVLIPELFRFIGMPDAAAANLRQIIYGLALIGIMYFRPQGLMGKIVLK